MTSFFTSGINASSGIGTRNSRDHQPSPHRALEEAGIDRKKVYVTNAVKHFRFVPRGKTRLHQKPNTAEIKACRQWYERELNPIKPDLVVAMGATAAQSVFGKNHADQQEPRASDRSRGRH